MPDPEVKKRRPTEKRHLPNYTFRWVTLVVELVVALSAVAYSIVAGCQWQTMKRQLEQQETQSQQLTVLQEQAERPWLVASSIKLDRPIKDGEGVAATVILVNSGRTPANGVVFGTTIYVTNQKIVSDLTLTPSPDSYSVGVVAPGATIQESGESQYLLGNGGTTLIEGKKAHIVVYGKVNYNIRRGQGETGFCAIYNPVTKAFSPHSVGNYAK